MAAWRQTRRPARSVPQEEGRPEKGRARQGLAAKGRAESGEGGAAAAHAAPQFDARASTFRFLAAGSPVQVDAAGAARQFDAEAAAAGAAAKERSSEGSRRTAEKNEVIVSRSRASESAVLIAVRRCDPLSRPLV